MFTLFVPLIPPLRIYPKETVKNGRKDLHKKMVEVK